MTTSYTVSHKRKANTNFFSFSHKIYKYLNIKIYNLLIFFSPLKLPFVRYLKYPVTPLNCALNINKDALSEIKHILSLKGFVKQLFHPMSHVRPEKYFAFFRNDTSLKE